MSRDDAGVEESLAKAADTVSFFEGEKRAIREALARFAAEHPPRQGSR